MAIDVRLLFKLKGRAGPELQRVEEAMEWLLSPKAEGIGEKLLRDAHELHGKPVTIEAVEGLTAYHPPHLGHKITIDPKFVAGTTMTDASGKVHAMSAERSLAHELKHAGQKELTQKAEEDFMGIQLKAAERMNASMSAEQQAAQQKYIGAIAEAKDYVSAMQHAERYVDEIIIPMQEKSLKIMKDDPDFLKYVETIEQPAMDIENNVARIRDEPIRENYLDSFTIGDKALKENAMHELTKLFDLHELPGAPRTAEETLSWADSITKSGDRQIT